MHPVILVLLSSITTDWVWLLIFTRFLDHTQRRTTVGRTSLNEWSVRRRDLYLTTHNSHNRQTSMPPTCWGFLFTLKNPTASAGFEPANLGTKVLYHRSRCKESLGNIWWILAIGAPCCSGNFYTSTVRQTVVTQSTGDLVPHRDRHIRCAEPRVHFLTIKSSIHC